MLAFATGPRLAEGMLRSQLGDENSEGAPLSLQSLWQLIALGGTVKKLTVTGRRWAFDSTTPAAHTSCPDGSKLGSRHTFHLIEAPDGCDGPRDVSPPATAKQHSVFLSLE